MKKIICVILAAMLLTGCTGEKDNWGSYDPEKDPNAAYRNVFERAVEYFPSYDYPTEDGLPMMKNNGAVSLKESFENDERFRPLLEEFAGEPDFQKRCDIAEKILTFLCGAEGISEEEGSFSERKLTILRKIWSEDQERAAEEVPEPQNEPEIAKLFQTQYLEWAYEALIFRYCLSLICSLAYNNTSYIKKYTDSEGSEYPYMGYFNRHLCYSFELGEMSEQEFCDSVTAMSAFEIMKSKSLRMTAEFYAYVEEMALLAYDGSSKKCLELTRETLKMVNEFIGSREGIYVVIHGESDDMLEGRREFSCLLIGGGGSDEIGGVGGDHFMIGGEGDDVYEITEGCDMIFDCHGHNLIRFMKSKSVYAVGFSEDDLKDDVKLCYGDGYLIIKNFLSDSGTLFDVEINGRRIAYDSPENPLSDIHEPGYVPDTAAPPR